MHHNKEIRVGCNRRWKQRKKDTVGGAERVLVQCKGDRQGTDQ